MSTLVITAIVTPSEEQNQLFLADLLREATPAPLDKTNTIIAVLGHNPDPKQGRNFNIPQDKWIEGIFAGTHGSAWDAEGNLYVQDWNVAGRIMKLVRVKDIAK